MAGIFRELLVRPSYMRNTHINQTLSLKINSFDMILYIIRPDQCTSIGGRDSYWFNIQTCCQRRIQRDGYPGGTVGKISKSSMVCNILVVEVLKYRVKSQILRWSSSWTPPSNRIPGSATGYYVTRWKLMEDNFWGCQMIKYTIYQREARQSNLVIKMRKASPPPIFFSHPHHY